MHPVSKSQYTTAINCIKAFYIKRKKLIKIEWSEAQLDKFDSGREFEAYIQELFPQSVNIEKEGAASSEYLELTSEYLKAADKTIFEASISVEINKIPLYCMIDVLEPVEGQWNIYEIKSTTEVKPQHIPDAAFQYFAALQAGLKIKSVNIVHLNTKYFRKGKLDIAELRVNTDVTEEVKAYHDDLVRELKKIEQVDTGETMPDIDIGLHCLDPYECPYKAFCWDEIPVPSVFDFFGKKTASRLYSDGHVLLDSVHPPVKGLNKKKERMLELTQKDQEWVDEKGVMQFLSKVTYPLYYFDFETYVPLIPPFDKTKTYMQIPFQYSIHRRNSKDAELTHLEYLAPGDGNDPRRLLAENLLRDLGESGSIMVYNLSFEKSILAHLADLFPDLSSALKKCIRRMIDLMIPFRDHVYHPAMYGSASIKKVLPTFTGISYEGLEVSEGGEAMVLFKKMQKGKIPVNELDKIRESLLEYCKLDTLAMVKLHDVLVDLTASKV